MKYSVNPTMFLQNKYTKWYFSIISSAKQNPPLKGERHHVIPSSLGGADEKENLVLMSPRQHFICHKLLIKMLEGKQKAKMVHAFCFMALTKNNKCLNRQISARDYQKARELCKTLIYTPERNAKISAARKGLSIPRSDESKQRHRQTLADKKAAGIGLSEEHKNAIGKGLIGNQNGRGCVITEEHREIISQRNSKSYEITTPSGSKFTVTGIQKWLRTMNCNTCIVGREYRRGPLKGYTIIVLP